MHTQYLWLMPKYWLNTIFVADANILAEYWHEPNDTIYWEGPLSCGMYGTIALKWEILEDIFLKMGDIFLKMGDIGRYFSQMGDIGR